MKINFNHLPSEAKPSEGGDEGKLERSKLHRLFNSQTQTTTGAAGILILSALISRILGIARDWLLAKNFGAGPELDIYFAAFRIPDLVYNILIAGGITIAFLPLFSEYFAKDKKEAFRFTNNTLNIFLFFLLILGLILFIFTPFLIKLITPGFDKEQLAKTVFLTRLMFLSPIFLGLSSIFSGILQYFNRFLIYGLCPIFYNLGIIFGISFLAPAFGILGVVMGVIFGAFLHLIIQIPTARHCGFKYQLIFNHRDSGIKKVFKLMFPRTFGVAASQIGLIVSTAIASTLAAGSITIFNLAYNLQSFPIGIIGISFALAVFPQLSQNFVSDQKEKFRENFSLTFRQILYLIIPLSVLTFVLRNQITEILFRHGQFGKISAQLTAASLGLFCFGIFAHGLIPLLLRAFFSFQETKIPTVITVLGIILGIFLSFYLTNLLQFPNALQIFLKKSLSLGKIENIQILGLPLAFSLSGIFQFILLLVFLYKKIGDFKIREIFHSFLKIFFAGLFMAGTIYFCLTLSISGNQNFLKVFWQTAAAGGVGILIYLFFTYLFHSPEIKAFLNKSNGKNL